jgi:signal transduction histidine kinase/DNA-binding NarL/FixJ family response regulator
MPEATLGGADERFMTGGGEMGALMRAHDWSHTPLGPVRAWPQSLRTSVSTCLECAFPILVWWGPDLVMLYNDEYRQILGAKHPGALGAKGGDIFPELWAVIEPMLDQVMFGGTATRARDLQLLMNRHGYEEETYFSFSYSPIHDESGGIGGVFTPVFETTERVIGERRLKTLRDMAATTRPRSARDAFQSAADVLAQNPCDVPFAMIYQVDQADGVLRFVCAAGITEGAPSAIDLALSEPDTGVWPVRSTVERGETTLVRDLAERFSRLPTGAWPDSPNAALVLPIALPGHDRPYAVLIAASSPRRALDDEYRSFFDLICGQIGQTLAEALAFEEEKKRAEALAEIDRAKTLFFSNVSHEFRTPLTLMLGPLEELMDGGPELPPVQRGLLALAHRNSLRLLKLVNTLLDFSRIEAGRTQAEYQPVDLAQLTAELVSNFRSATERAGLGLSVVATPLPQPVYLDPEMWEKIVLNLVSNAFKFTFEGEIRVEVGVSADARSARMTVSDTGVGIPASEIPRLFERFHRSPETRGRSIEGSGIGLALVQELVKLHGGAIEVASEPGRGSEFSVSLPFGSQHLPAEQVKPQSAAAVGSSVQAFVEEALRSIPQGADASGRGLDGLADFPDYDADHLGEGRRVLLADDNADMRDYLRRLLEGAGYEVEVVADGESALASARRLPDLVLSDVMMPGMDGFELLERIRSDETTRDVPCIMVSARAGAEARIEGLRAGADDYVVKPFSARELLARVSAVVRLAEARQEAARSMQSETLRTRRLFNQAPGTIAILKGPDHVFEFANESYGRLVGQRDLIGRKVRDAFPEIEGQGFFQLLQNVYATGERFVGRQMPIVFKDPDAEGERKVFLDFIFEAITGANGEVTGIFVEGFDVTDRVAYEQHLRLLIDELNHRVKNTLAIVQGIAQQTFKGAAVPKDRTLAFEGRLAALAAAHGLLTRANWVSADLGEIASETLRVHGARRYSISGPCVPLEPKTAVTMAMALHELATNAAKYGAFSGETGAVTLSWSVEAAADAALRMVWEECGGPPVQPPGARGFGSRMIETALAEELRGEVQMDWRSTGLVCRIRAPLPAAAANLAAGS